jgi:extracellular factor (EF) 3-hydroxypalmitic acid methyl ester biosynthesis protein
MKHLDLASCADAGQDDYVLVQSENNAAAHPDNMLMLSKMLAAGGPEETEYPFLDGIMSRLYVMKHNGQLDSEGITILQNVFHDDFMDNTIHGYVYKKPLGYAGDFALIDMIYTYDSFGHARYQKWDRYFHYHAATQAVRNRKAFFKEKMLLKLKDSKEPLNLLDVASGPARDLLELYQLIDPERLKTTCVDIDVRAISFAGALCQDYQHQISFCHKNILRFSSAEKYDVIWSAGLFDYFEDKIFVMALKRLLTFLKPGGEILIGNFSDNNPSRGYMEIFGEWFLIHRSPQELVRLSMQAGVHPDHITVEQEPLGINLFLKIRSVIPAGQPALCMN